ncbi:DUF1097 domain-containing protein [Microbulbifer marinus]|uniref:Fusaric acid resistance protein-like n=1 Tax=Microbulbifer marinus TaxID=658218 RepID=A0A1H3WRT4_9GAMM|nr:DUF1097 domain-containing protein [Microbulbifer marinus]SDZ89670.1 Protein of unknown function [Microbulbifer marinus]
MSQAMISEHTTAPAVSPRSLLKLRSAFEIAGAVTFSLLAGLPVWIALAGWVSYYSRGSSLRDGAYNLACLVTGLGIGIVSQAAAVKWHPDLGMLAMPAALVFAAASVWLMNVVTGVNNFRSYLIGIAVVIVAGMDTSLDSYLMLTAAVTLGAFVAALPDLIRQKRESEVE